MSVDVILTKDEFVASVGIVNLQRFQLAVDDDPAIVTSFDGCSLKRSPWSLRVHFASAISAPELAALQAIAAVHTGQSQHEADLDPAYTLMARIPRTRTSSGGGIGNASIVSVPRFGVIVPAAGNGARNVDLSNACPVPAGGDGYWDVDGAGNVTASATPGAAGWHLLSVAVEIDEWRGKPHNSWEMTLKLSRKRFKISAWRRKNRGA